jgi:hypothetical protein
MCPVGAVPAASLAVTGETQVQFLVISVFVLTWKLLRMIVVGAVPAPKT